VGRRWRSRTGSTPCGSRERETPADAALISGRSAIGQPSAEEQPRPAIGANPAPPPTRRTGPMLRRPTPSTSSTGRSTTRSWPCWPPSTLAPTPTSAPRRRARSPDPHPLARRRLTRHAAKCQALGRMPRRSISARYEIRVRGASRRYDPGRIRGLPGRDAIGGWLALHTAERRSPRPGCFAGGPRPGREDRA